MRRLGRVEGAALHPQHGRRGSRAAAGIPGGPLAAHGWDVHVALTRGGPNLARLESGGASIHWLRVRGNHDPRLAARLASVVRKVRPDVVQVWFVQMEVVGGIVSELLGRPWVMSERSSALAYPPSIKNRARVLVARTANAIVSNSRAGDEYWQTRVSPRVSRFIVGNALPLEEVDAAPAALPATMGISPDDAVVLFAGRFEREKNVDVMLTAVREAVERPRTVAILCGDGPLRAEMARTIADAGLSNRILTPGYVSGLWSVMKRADVVISVGRFEGHPNVVLEAMACRRPLVVSDIAAHREILDDRSALFVDPGDPSSIAAGVRRMLDDRADATARANAARLRAEAFSTGAAAAHYDRVYREILARRRSADERTST